MQNTTVNPNKLFLDVLNKIRQEQFAFSAAQRQVAAYVLENYHQIPFLSISSLAENIGVSNNSIIKFCNQLGFAKFTEFKRVFADHAHTELTTFNKSAESATEDKNNYFCQGMEDDVSAIQATLSNPTNMENMPKLLSMIKKADHIYVSGGLRSGGLAWFLAAGLRLMDLRAHHVEAGTTDYWQRIRMATPKDLVICICLPRYAPDAVDTLKKLRKQGVPTVVITDTGLSPVLPHADLAFLCSLPSTYYLPSCAGVMSLLDVICRGVSHQVVAEKHQQQKKVDAPINDL